MDWLQINNIASLITAIGVVVLYFTVKNILPSYFNEKGKNIATKEDISDITQLVESVKYSFTTDSEKFKANLLLLNNIHSGLIGEERNAIIDINEKYFNWLNILIDTSLGNIDMNSNIELDRYHVVVSQSYSNFLNSETRFTLFVEDEKLISYTGEMKIATMKKLSGPVPIYILECKHINNQIETLLLQPISEERNQQYEALLNTRITSLEKCRNGIIEGYKEIVQINKEFQKMSKQYLYKLISR